MNTFFYKLAMLVMFILAVVCGWSALYMVFDITLWNILLGILAAFFLFRALELTDRINKLGPYSEKEEHNLGSSSSSESPRQDEHPDEDAGEN